MMTTEEKILQLVREANPDNPQEYVDSIVRPFMLEKINMNLSVCNICGKCSKTRSLISGNSNATVLLIGESVTEEQYRQFGESYIIPYQGTAAGTYLQNILGYYGFDMNQIMLVNAVNCFCHEEVDGKVIGRAPSREEEKECKKFLNYLIKAMNPVVVIFLGNIAMNMFHKGNIKQEHGKWLEANGIPAVPVYSPEMMLACQQNDPELYLVYEDELKNDFEKVVKMLKDEYKDFKIINK